MHRFCRFCLFHMCQTFDLVGFRSLSRFKQLVLNLLLCDHEKAEQEPWLTTLAHWHFSAHRLADKCWNDELARLDVEHSCWCSKPWWRRPLPEFAWLIRTSGCEFTWVLRRKMFTRHIELFLQHSFLHAFWEKTEDVPHNTCCGFQCSVSIGMFVPQMPWWACTTYGGLCVWLKGKSSGTFFGKWWKMIPKVSWSLVQYLGAVFMCSGSGCITSTNLAPVFSNTWSSVRSRRRRKASLMKLPSSGTQSMHFASESLMKLPSSGTQTAIFASESLMKLASFFGVGAEAQCFASVVGAFVQGEQFEECSSDEKQLSNHDAKGLNISVTQPCSCFMKHFWKATFHEAHEAISGKPFLWHGDW